MVIVNLEYLHDLLNIEADSQSDIIFLAIHAQTQKHHKEQGKVNVIRKRNFQMLFLFAVFPLSQVDYRAQFIHIYI